MVETAAPIDAPAEVVAVSVAMLTDLRDKELGLLELILAHLPPPTLVEIAATCAFLRTCALSSADQRVRALITSDRRVSRWRRSGYEGRFAIFRELHHIEGAAQYAHRVAGRFRLGTFAALDISPSGEFVNYSCGDPEDGYCFRGIMTVAGVIPRGRRNEPLYLLDRWYVAAWRKGELQTAESLSFVGPGYQCYSVSTSEEREIKGRGGGGRSSKLVLYENEPGPDAARSWKVPREMPVFRGSSSYDERPDLDPDGDPDGDGLVADEVRSVLRLSFQDGVLPLRKVAERELAWPEGGLVPLTDTRLVPVGGDLSLSWVQPSQPPDSQLLRVHHFSPHIADLRVALS